MSLKIYLTTDAKPLDGSYACWIWRRKPALHNGRWEQDGGGRLFVDYYKSLSNIAALGFPKPGDIRVVDIGPCGEGE